MKQETPTNSRFNKKSGLVWFLAGLLTIGLAVYQRMTGPTYPAKGEISFLGEKVSFKLPRSAENLTDCPVVINLPPGLAGQVQGYLQFRRPKEDKPWNILSMKADGQQLTGFLPKQPPAGKFEYFVHLVKDSQEVSLPGEKPVLIRFKGKVSTPVLLAHILVMFLGMLFRCEPAWLLSARLKRQAPMLNGQRSRSFWADSFLDRLFRKWPSVISGRASRWAEM